MTWDKIPDSAKPGVVESLAQLLRASSERLDNNEDDDD